MQDNATVEETCVFGSNNVSFCPWSAKAPEINSIGNLWYQLERAIKMSANLLCSVIDDLITISWIQVVVGKTRNSSLRSDWKQL